MWQPGTRVRVEGLQAAAAQHHNGAEALVVESPSAAAERATVKLVSGDLLRAPPSCLALRTECSLCKTAGKALKACSQCSVSAYCSKQCQVSHWKSGHKKECGSASAAPRAEQARLLSSIQSWYPRNGLNATVIFDLENGRQPMLPCYNGEKCHASIALNDAFRRFRDLATAFMERDDYEGVASNWDMIACLVRHFQTLARDDKSQITHMNMAPTKDTKDGKRSKGGRAAQRQTIAACTSESQRQYAAIASFGASTVGKALRRVRKLEAALPIMLQARETLLEVAGADRFVDQLDNLAEDEMEIGNVYDAMQDNQNALTFYSAAIGHVESHMQASGESVHMKHLLSLTLGKAAISLLRLGQAEQAHEWHRRAISIALRYVKLSTSLSPGKEMCFVWKTSLV